MARLLRDRCYEYAPDRWLDLLTGETHNAPPRAALPRRAPPPDALIELLEHGREGWPRSIAIAEHGHGLRAQACVAADAAVRCGYVPVSVRVYLGARLFLSDDLRDRALMLIGLPGTRVEALHAALLRAAAASPRPHVLVTFRSTVGGHHRPPLVVGHAQSGTQGSGWRMHEARAAYGVRPLRVGAAAIPTDVARLLERADKASELVHAGRHAAATRLLRETAAALARRRAPSAAAETYVRLGRLLLERGATMPADAAFAEAAAQAEGADPPLVASARVWQAAARTDAGQLTAAESLCRAALLTGALDDTEQARCEATLARVLLWQERLAEARMLGIVRAPASSNPFVAATVVRVLLADGASFEAGQRARDLLTCTERPAEPVSRVIALSAHLRVLLAAGDLSLGEDCLRDVIAAARIARTPLRAARARLLWAEALRRAGQDTPARRELRRLTRMQNAMPPLLRGAVNHAARDPVDARMVAPRTANAAPQSAVDLVVAAQRDEDDEEALRHVCERVRRDLGAARIDMWTADGGPPTASIQCGAGLPTQLGPRALEAGIVIGPELVASGHEIAAPVRLGPKLVGAIAVRWPTDRIPPSDFEALLSIGCAVSAPRVESMLHARQQAAQAATAIPELVGASSAILDLRRAVSRAAAAPFSVLIEGESGVGKELVARAIHQSSPRRDRRFCDVNCAAVPDELFESELFGHARGAFTGAVVDRAGLVEEADGGTLFLDEIADLSLRAQAKLLRVVQQHEVRRVGETFVRKVDVRFVSAANRDLRAEAEQGRFRQDLLYRLDVIRVRIPPLRERPEDIVLLARHFWALAAPRVNTHAALSHDVLAALARHHWPGNVRELQNVIAALAVEAPVRGHVRASALPAAIAGSQPGAVRRLSEARLQWERRFVELALARAGGNRSRAARELGLTRQGLLKVLMRVGLAANESG